MTSAEVVCKRAVNVNTFTEKRRLRQYDGVDSGNQALRFVLSSRAIHTALGHLIPIRHSSDALQSMKNEFHEEEVGW